MKNSTRLFVTLALGGAAIAANASISFLAIDDMGLTSLSDAEMSSLRGGFVSVNDTIINIGLSMTTAVNGETVLSTHIADFTINNGLLVGQNSNEIADNYDPLKIIQYGENNVFDGLPSVDSTGAIIQNSVDGVSIYTETTLNIEADVKSYTQQSIFRNRLENAILYSGY